MSEIELTIHHEENGGDIWLQIKGGALRDDACFTIIDAEAADLIEDILRARRPGTYQFGPLDLNQ